MIKVPHSFEVHSNESACRKKVRLGLEQVTYSTGLGGLSRGLGIYLCVTLSSGDSCDIGGDSLALPYKNIVEEDTIECTYDANIFSFA